MLFPMKQLLYLLLCVALFVACGPEAIVPTQSTPTQEQVRLYPDYRDIVIPPNIAPLNLLVRTPCEASVLHLEGKGGEIVVAASANEALCIDTLKWRNLLTANKGGELRATIYTQQEGEWRKHPAYALHVAQEPIDPYLSYRLIEPSYELYRQLGLYQRNLTNFEQTPIYENNSEFDNNHNHCINCHNYQNYNTDRMLLHVRAQHGGTVFVQGNKATRMDMKNDSVLGSSVYPTWHPTQPWVVFSTNKTGQAFHMAHAQKVEVLDYASDLVFYDVERNEIRNILKTSDTMETFPAWSPDGRKLFYCAAPLPLYNEMPDSVRRDTERHADVVLGKYSQVRYNLMSMEFDPKTRRFSAPKVEMDCAAMGKSCTVPRVSPDGRYVLFTLGDYGQFHIWHKSSDLYVKDLLTGKISRLDKANSSQVDSYHSWSSNGRWMVFSSRRDDGSYTRPYIAYFDRNGRDHKAFLLPQEAPHQNFTLMKSYNVPELTRTPVKISPEALRETIYADDRVGKVKYAQ